MVRSIPKLIFFQLLRVLTSAFGLAVINIVYLLVGSYVFFLIEAPKENAILTNLEQGRSVLVGSLFTIFRKKKNAPPQPHPKSDQERASDALGLYEDALATFYRKRTISGKGANTNNTEGAKIWTRRGSVIYAYSVVTTIGWGNIVPSTLFGRLATICYGFVGIPLVFTLSSEVSSFTAKTIKLFYYVFVYKCACLRSSGEDKSMNRYMPKTTDSAQVPAGRLSHQKDVGYNHLPPDPVDPHDPPGCLTGDAGYQYTTTRDDPGGGDGPQTKRKLSYYNSVRSTLDFLVEASKDPTVWKGGPEAEKLMQGGREMRGDRKQAVGNQRNGRRRVSTSENTMALYNKPRYRLRSMEDAMKLSEELGRLSVEELCRTMTFVGIDFERDVLMAGDVGEGGYDFDVDGSGPSSLGETRLRGQSKRKKHSRRRGKHGKDRKLGLEDDHDKKWPDSSERLKEKIVRDGPVADYKLEHSVSSEQEKEEAVSNPTPYEKSDFFFRGYPSELLGGGEGHCEKKIHSEMKGAQIDVKTSVYPGNDIGQFRATVQPASSEFLGGGDISQRGKDEMGLLVESADLAKVGIFGCGEQLEHLEVNNVTRGSVVCDHCAGDHGESGNLTFPLAGKKSVRNLALSPPRPVSAPADFRVTSPHNKPVSQVAAMVFSETSDVSNADDTVATGVTLDGSASPDMTVPPGTVTPPGGPSIHTEHGGSVNHVDPGDTLANTKGDAFQCENMKLGVSHSQGAGSELMHAAGGGDPASQRQTGEEFEGWDMGDQTFTFVHTKDVHECNQTKRLIWSLDCHEKAGEKSGLVTSHTGRATSEDRTRIRQSYTLKEITPSSTKPKLIDRYVNRGSFKFYDEEQFKKQPGLFAGPTENLCSAVHEESRADLYQNYALSGILQPERRFNLHTTDIPSTHQAFRIFQNKTTRVPNTVSAQQGHTQKDNSQKCYREDHGFELGNFKTERKIERTNLAAPSNQDRHVTETLHRISPADVRRPSATVGQRPYPTNVRNPSTNDPERLNNLELGNLEERPTKLHTVRSVNEEAIDQFVSVVDAMTVQSRQRKEQTRHGFADIDCAKITDTFESNHISNIRSFRMGVIKPQTLPVQAQNKSKMADAPITPCTPGEVRRYRRRLGPQQKRRMCQHWLDKNFVRSQDNTLTKKMWSARKLGVLKAMGRLRHEEIVDGERQAQQGVGVLGSEDIKDQFVCVMGSVEVKGQGIGVLSSEEVTGQGVGVLGSEEDKGQGIGVLGSEEVKGQGVGVLCRAGVDDQGVGEMSIAGLDDQELRHGPPDTCKRELHTFRRDLTRRWVTSASLHTEKRLYTASLQTKKRVKTESFQAGNRVTGLQIPALQDSNTLARQDLNIPAENRLTWSADTKKDDPQAAFCGVNDLQNVLVPSDKLLVHDKSDISVDFLPHHDKRHMSVDSLPHHDNRDEYVPALPLRRVGRDCDVNMSNKEDGAGSTDGRASQGSKPKEIPQATRDMWGLLGLKSDTKKVDRWAAFRPDDKRTLKEDLEILQKTLGMAATATEPTQDDEDDIEVPLMFIYVGMLFFMAFGAFIHVRLNKDIDDIFTSVYFVYVLCSTTGFGDILPDSSSYAFELFYCLVGVAMFNITVNATLQYMLATLDYLKILTR